MSRGWRLWKQWPRNDNIIASWDLAKSMPLTDLCISSLFNRKNTDLSTMDRLCWSRCTKKLKKDVWIQQAWFNSRICVCRMIINNKIVPVFFIRNTNNGEIKFPVPVTAISKVTILPRCADVNYPNWFTPSLAMFLRGACIGVVSIETSIYPETSLLRNSDWELRIMF